MTKHWLIFVAIILLGISTGGIGFLAFLPWIIYGQVEAEMKREKEERY